MQQEWLRSVFTLIGIVIILIACYYTTSYIGRRAMGQNRAGKRSGGRSITLLERFAISKDKSLCIIEIAGKIYIVGVTNQAMTVLDTLDPAQFAEHSAERQNTTAAWNMPPGGKYGGKLVNRLAAFMAGRMGKSYGPDTYGGEKGATFADVMKNKRNDDEPGQTNRKEADRDDSSEEE